MALMWFHIYRFFSSYSRGAAGWNYILGNFAQQSLPLSDSVNLKLQLVNQSSPVDVVVSRFSHMFLPNDHRE